MIEELGRIILQYHFVIMLIVIGFSVWLYAVSEEKHRRRMHDEAMAREVDKYEPQNEDSLGV